MRLADLTVPGPTITPVSSPFWAAAAEGRLVLQHCEACDHAVFYPRAICPHCWSPKLNWQAASGLGTLETWSRIERPGHPGWEPAAPYHIGIVRLAEGPKMLTHLLVDAPALHMALQVRFTDVGGILLPCFGAVDA